MANIDAFKANLLGGGARANQFFVQLTFPSYVAGGPLLAAKGQFICKGAQLPASTIDNTPTFFIHKKSARSTDYDHAFTLELAMKKAEFWLNHVRIGWGWKSTPTPEGNDQ